MVHNDQQRRVSANNPVLSGLIPVPIQANTSIMSGMPGNPLRTLLDGLKKVFNTSDHDSGSSHFPPPLSSTSSQIQAVPQMLVPNRSAVQQTFNNQFQANTPHSVSAGDVRTQFQTNFLQEKSLRHPPAPTSAYNHNNNNRTGFDSNERNLNGQFPQQSLSSSSFQKQSSFPTSGSRITNGLSPPTNNPQQLPLRPRLHPQPLPTMAPPVSIQTTQPLLQTLLTTIDQQEANRIKAVFNRIPYQQPALPMQQPQPPVNHDPSPSYPQHLPPRPGVFLSNQPGNGMPQPLMQHQPSQITPTHSPNSFTPALKPTVDSRTMPNQRLQSQQQSVHIPISIDSNNQSQCLPPVTTAQSQSPVPKTSRHVTSNADPQPPEINTPELLRLLSSDSMGSLSVAGPKAGDTISSMLKGFKEMLHVKPTGADVTTISHNDLPGKLVNDSNGNGVVSNDGVSNRHAEIGADGSSSGSQDAPVSTCHVIVGHQSNPMVKTEVVEIDDEDDDCIMTGWDVSKKIFVLDKNFDGSVIDLVDDEETDNVVHAGCVIKPDPDAVERVMDAGVVHGTDTVETVTTSASVVSSCQAERKEAVAEKAIASTDNMEEKDENNSAMDTVAGSQTVSDKNEGKESHQLKSPSSMQHIVSAVGNILHSMKGNETTISKDGAGLAPTSVEAQKAVRNEMCDELVRNDFSDADEVEEIEQIVDSSAHDSKALSSKDKIKPCSVSIKRVDVDIAPLHSKSAECFTPKNTISAQEKSASRNESIINDNSGANPKSKSPVNTVIKRRKRGPKPGSKRGVKRPRSNEGKSHHADNQSSHSVDEQSNHGQDEQMPSPDQFVSPSYATAAKSQKNASQLERHNTLRMKQGVKNKNTVEVTSLESKTNMEPISVQKNQREPTKDSNTFPKTKEKSPALSIEKSISSDDDDDSDSDRMSNSSYSSESDSSDDADVQYTCKLCSKTFNKRSHLKKHMKSHYKKGDVKKLEKKVLCKGCRRKFVDTTALQAHLLQRRYCFFDCTRAFWKKKEESLQIVCQMCGKGQAKLKDIKKHSYRDLTCRLRFINLVLEHTKKREKDHSRDAVNVHTDSKPGDKKLNVSGKVRGKEDDEELDTAMSSQRSLSEVSNESHQEQSENVGNSRNYCSACEYEFESPVVFRDHLNITDSCRKFYSDPKNDCPIKLNYCPLCCIFMPSQSKLLSHLCCGKSKRAMCNVCCKPFSDERAMRIHQRKSTCGLVSDESMAEVNSGRNVEKVAGSSNSISCGDKSSSQSKPYSCDVCRKSFDQIQELLDHSHSHTYEGRYKCKECSMAFPRYNGLVWHMIWHKRKQDQEGMNKEASTSVSKQGKTCLSVTTTKTTYKCSYCPLIFKSEIRYASHTRVHKAKLRKKKTGKKITPVNTKREKINSEVDVEFSCSKCNQKCSTLSGRNDHFKVCRQGQVGRDKNNDTVSSTSKDEMEVDPSDRFHQCTLCTVIIKKPSFWSHLGFHMNGIRESLKQANQSPDDHSKAKCIICKTVFDSNEILLEHLLVHKAKDIIGPAQELPSKRFRSRPIFKIPGALVLDVENAGRSLSLKSPTKDTFSPTHKVVTRKIARRTHRISCNICHKTFPNIVTFKFHSKVVHRNIDKEEWTNYVIYTQKTDNDDELRIASNSSSSDNRLTNSVLPHMAANMIFNVSCEICQKVVQKKNRARHMHDVHGLPKTMFQVRPRKSPGIDIKKEMENTGGQSSYSKDSFQRIEVDMGGANITNTSSCPIRRPSNSSLDGSGLNVFECTICDASFLHRRFLWKHLFSHITPCSVTGMKLEDIIKEVPSGVEDENGVGRDLGDTGNGALEMDVDGDDEVTHPSINISIADEASVSFDVGYNQ